MLENYLIHISVHIYMYLFPPKLPPTKVTPKYLLKVKKKIVTKL